MDTTTSHRLNDLPLWRLLVMLADAERLAGPDSQSARAIAAAVQAKLHPPRLADREAPRA